MVLGVKFMAVPGEQWTIRRDTYQQIRDEFEKNGIKFAARDVQVKVVSDRPLTRQENKRRRARCRKVSKNKVPQYRRPMSPKENPSAFVSSPDLRTLYFGFGK